MTKEADPSIDTSRNGSISVSEERSNPEAATSELPEECSNPATQTTENETSRSCCCSLQSCHYYCSSPPYHGNQEALAFALDAMGRAVSFIGAGAFLSTALLGLAKEAAGCSNSSNDADSPTTTTYCNERVYGIRPSSLLTTYTIVVGIVSTTFMPLLGAIVDYTPHRRLVGRITSTVFCTLLFPQIFVSSTTWFAVALLQMMVAFVGWAQTMVTYAYLPELTDSEERLLQYTQSFTVVTFGSMVLYLAAIVGIAAAADLDDVATARLGQAVSFTIATLFLYVAWGRLFQKRPRARTLPAERNLWTAGFVQVWHTAKHIYRHLRALKWFYISIAFVDAAINSLATIMITYLTDTLQFTSQENGITVLCMLVGSLPGAVAAGKTSTRLNPIRSSIIATLLLMLNTVAAAIVLQGPGQQLATYLFAGGWGVGSGWKWTTDRLLASIIIPTGQDAELMGFYLFAGQVLTWLPPLIFTVLNEAGVSQRVGIGTQAIYFFIGIVALMLMGSYQAALEVAGRATMRLGDNDQINNVEMTECDNELQLENCGVGDGDASDDDNDGDDADVDDGDDDCQSRNEENVP